MSSYRLRHAYQNINMNTNIMMFSRTMSTRTRLAYEIKTRLHSTSKYSYRKERKEVAKKLGKNSKELDWEHYEFAQK